jgi:hypothetical protein
MIVDLGIERALRSNDPREWTASQMLRHVADQIDSGQIPDVGIAVLSIQVKLEEGFDIVTYTAGSQSHLEVVGFIQLSLRDLVNSED